MADKGGADHKGGGKKGHRQAPKAPRTATLIHFRKELLEQLRAAADVAMVSVSAELQARLERDLAANPVSPLARPPYVRPTFDAPRPKSGGQPPEPGPGE